MSVVAVYMSRNERNRQTKIIKLLRRRLRDSENPFDSTSENHFLELYRFPKSLCRDLCNEIEPFLSKRTYAHGISSEIRVLCALRFFASGCFQRSVGQDFFSTLSQTMVSRCISEVANALNNIAAKHVYFPKENETAQIKNSFYRVAGFPGAIGAIDGTHIKIVAPAKAIEHVYFCRKGGHSKNVQIVCDANLIIMNVNARFGGTAHDAYIWRRSALKTCLENRYLQGKRDFWLLGDSGYPLQPWLMTPILTTHSEAEKRYNRSHKVTRCIVERCIGVLKSRFRCISKERTLRYSPEKSGNIINACVVLHNILMRAKIPYEEFLPVEEVEDEPLRDETEAIEDVLREGRDTLNNLIRVNFF